MNDDTVLAQLHRTLLDAMRRSRPGALGRPVTVAEIYQDLLPYRVARTAAGFEMNADYEHALLRLLAGEGDYARIEPREVRDKLRMELDSPNPDVGLFRNYAMCDVWISVNEGEDVAVEEPVVEAPVAPASWEDEFLGHGVDEDEVEIELEPEADEEPFEAPVDEADSVEEQTPDPANRRFEIAAEPAPDLPAEEEPAAQDVCAFCGADLPDDRIVNFCPFCGTDQSQRPCPSCGELLDPLWRFCVSCGTRVRPLGDHVN